MPGQPNSGDKYAKHPNHHEKPNDAAIQGQTRCNIRIYQQKLPQIIIVFVLQISEKQLAGLAPIRILSR